MRYVEAPLLCYLEACLIGTTVSRYFSLAAIITSSAFYFASGISPSQCSALIFLAPNFKGTILSQLATRVSVMSSSALDHYVPRHHAVSVTVVSSAKVRICSEFLTGRMLFPGGTRGLDGPWAFCSSASLQQVFASRIDASSNTFPRSSYGPIITIKSASASLPLLC